METPGAVGGKDDHAIAVGDQQLLRGIAPELFHVFQVQLDHQHAQQSVGIPDFAGEVVAAPVGGGAEAEEARRFTLDRVLVVGAEGEVAADEAVRLVPVGGGLGLPVGAHQVDDVGTGALADVRQAGVRRVPGFQVFGLPQGGSQRRQFAEDRRQVLVATQRAEQVADVEVEGLLVLLGKSFAVVALGEVVKRPEQQD
ncbi:hypothetical protein AO738_28125 [Pseudomonas citronellolis]|nr:hypothetical protein AO742_04215 [Pseudomonas citronellolis]KRW79332.1 hypothetical protein AO738_28125 [Pseudomonas citronellolis]